MRYRQLGASGVRVSEVGIGAFPLSGYSTDDEGRRVGWSGASDAEAVALIHRAEELGINLVDSAESYGNGHSEEVVGSALRGRRDKWLIATKVTTNLGLEAAMPNLAEAARRRIRSAAEGSLRRLACDCIDLYQLHALPLSGARSAVMEELMALKQRGLIRLIGVSSNEVAAIRRLATLGDVDMLQVGYNLVERRGADTLDYARGAGMGTLIRVPLAKGMLTGKYFTDWELPADDVRHERFSRADTAAAFRRLPELAFLAERRTMPQAALRFTLDHPGTSCVIAGAKTVAQIEENAAAADVPPLTAAELRRALPLVEGLTVPNWAGN
ncbi:MAG: aldo/keto reductase [Spirochaetaceae bacterium]|nr:aldo/keto reductase [Spirochaetaceae bacterium]